MTTQTQQRAAVFDPLSLPIAVKIALGLGLVLLASAVFTTSLVRQTVQSARTEAVLGEMESLSRAQGFRVVDIIGQELVALSVLGQDPTVQAQLRSLAEQATPNVGGENPITILATVQGEISPFKTAHPELDSVALVDINGHVVAINPVQTEARNPSEAQPEPGSWLWFQDALNQGQGATYVSGPIDDRLTGLSGVHLAVPVYDTVQSDRVIGVLYAVWNLSNVPTPAQVRDREAIVAEPDGTVLHTTGDLTGALQASLLHNLQQTPSGSVTLADASGRQWIYGFTRLSDLGLQDEVISRLGWFIVTREPLDVTQADINVLTTRVNVAVGVSAALVTIGVAGLAFLVLRPLRRLTFAANQISQGSLDTEIPYLARDEVGNLADVMRTLVERLTYRLEQLGSAVEVSKAAAYSLEVNELLNNVAKTMEEVFKYPAVVIYLSDIGRHEARVRAVAGSESSQIAAVGDVLQVNERHAVGRAILVGEPQIGRVAGGLLSQRPELVIPLRSAGQSLGALYVVARAETVFEQEDIGVLNLVGDQISAAVENARLFEQSSSNLAEIEALNRRLTRQAWEEFLEEGSTVRHTLDPDQRWPGQLDALRASAEVTAEAYTDADGRSVLAAPIVLRGESIGTLAVTRPSGETWSRDERLIMESVASRLAMIAEGIRLVEETSMRATREQKVNEVSANLLQRAASVDNVLQTALNQLSGVLGSDHVSLRIGRPPVEDDRQIGAGPHPEASDPHGDSRSGNGQHSPADAGGKE